MQINNTQQNQSFGMKFTPKTIKQFRKLVCKKVLNQEAANVFDTLRICHDTENYTIAVTNLTKSKNPIRKFLELFKGERRNVTEITVSHTEAPSIKARYAAFYSDSEKERLDFVLKALSAKGQSNNFIRLANIAIEESQIAKGISPLDDKLNGLK